MAARRGKAGKRPAKRLNKRFEAFLSLSMPILLRRKKNVSYTAKNEE